MFKSCYAGITVSTACLALLGGRVFAQRPDHPFITEVYTNPSGASDGPVGHDPTNDHQEFLEIYLPTTADLAPGLNKDALNLTFYEVEGDITSSGYTLVNYRIDLPTFDLDPGNGLTPGAIERPSSGIVVLGWVDYVYSNTGTCAGDNSSCSVSAQNCADLTRCVGTPTDLAGTPGTRLGLVNGGITATTNYLFIAMNGRQFSGTTNFPVPDPSNADPDDALSLIHMPSEANSGIIQNGSSAYLLVNRDDPGYVKLFDDKDSAHVPPLSNADPALAAGNALQTPSFLDGVAGNDHDGFTVLLQPFQAGDPIDLADVLPDGGAYTLLIPQIAEDGGHGYLRRFGDVLKTTEDGTQVDDPVADALNAYRIISNSGPWFATPGRVTFTDTPPELSVADALIQVFDALTETTGRPGFFAANVGGNFAMEVTATPGPIGKCRLNTGYEIHEKLASYRFQPPLPGPYLQIIGMFSNMNHGLD